MSDPQETTTPPEPEATVKLLGGITGKGFMPGKSGNPGGILREPRLARALAQRHSVEAIRTLVDIMRNSRYENQRRLAAEAILDRALGKPVQELLVDRKDVQPMRVFPPGIGPKDVEEAESVMRAIPVKATPAP